MKKYLVMFVLLIIQYSCSQLDFFDNPSTNEDFPELRGKTIATIDETNPAAVNLYWARNNSSLYITGLLGLFLADTSTLQKTTIEEKGYVNELNQSNNGQELYYILFGDCSKGCFNALYRNSTDGLNPMIIQDSISNVHLATHNIALSRDGSSLAYIYSDSLFIYNTISNVKEFIIDDAIAPLIFSPDELYILYKSETSSDLMVLNIQNRTSEPVPFKIVGTIEMIHWDDKGIRVFYYNSGLLTMQNVFTNETTDVWEGQNSEDPYDYYSAWSPDGNKIAFWTDKCLKPNFFSCDLSQHSLYIYEITNHNLHKVAYLNDTPCGNMAFTPDSKQIAYVTFPNIYLVNTD